LKKYKLTKIGKMYIVSTYSTTEANYTKIKRRKNKGYFNQRRKKYGN